jgi:hypothetical protein
MLLTFLLKVPLGRLYVDLGGDILSNATDGGPTSGDEMALCWLDPFGGAGGGYWLTIDSIEYGNQSVDTDNTTLFDYPVTPDTGWMINRFPDPYTDIDNCTLDFEMSEVPEPPLTHNVSLDLGWNLISTPLVQADNDLSMVLSSITGNYDRCFHYNASDGSDNWKSYSSTRPPILNDLSTIDHTMGFWINVIAPCTLQTQGATALTQITLKSGWNMVGYPSLNPETVANALWSTSADRVMVCDTSNQYNIREVGPEYLMQPGEGYWVHVPVDTIWVVDW